jgi:hypothetical protein
MAEFFSPRVLFAHFLPVRTRRALLAAPTQSMAIHLEITDQGVAIPAEQEQPTVSWGKITAWVEGKRVILLCRTGAPPISFVKDF